MPIVAQLRISEAAAIAGVSDDTVRRLVESGAVRGDREGSRVAVDSLSLAEHLHAQAKAVADPTGALSSARNRLVGIVTSVKSDDVMSQVELQCGPFVMCSLMSTESVRDLGLEPGSLAVAVVKSTTVIVEVSGENR